MSKTGLMEKIRRARLGFAFTDSKSYWQERYAAGDTSGDGSYGNLAEFKAEFLNRYVADSGIESVIELGCGDGNQLSLANYPKYLGLDVAAAAITTCMKRYRDDSSKSFLWYDPTCAWNLENFLRADLTLSLDVIYHLVEDAVYYAYLDDLFSMARRFTIVYSSNMETESSAPHVRHRLITEDIEARHPGFTLCDTVENRYPEKSFCKFFVFERVGTVA